MDAPRLILASTSPRRRQLLAQLNVQFEVRSPQIDESIEPGETAEAYVIRMALQKGQAVALKLQTTAHAAILSADTIVVVDDQVLGKPASGEEAKRFLRQMSGRRHQVLTAVSLIIHTTDNQTMPRLRSVTTEVEFCEIGNQEIDWYVDTLEPSDKAGGYALQGIAGAWVRRIEGSVSNVIGLPLVETLSMLTHAGIRLPWTPVP